MRLLINRVNAGVKFTRFYSTALAKAEPAIKEEKETTGLHRIDTNHRNPFDLFKDWYGEYQTPDNNHLASKAFCLSTANREGVVSSRTLILRRLDEDGLVIMTDNRSRKAKDLSENPYASMVFLWISMRSSLLLSRQVRVEGKVEELGVDNFLHLYNAEPLFCKIRAHICHQGTESNWNSMKQNHDSFLEKYQNKTHNLQRPSHVVCYKLKPSKMEFYESVGQTIADRLLYVKKDVDWDLIRLAA